MTESAYSSVHGAEISERSTELLLPSSPAAATRGEPLDGTDATDPLNAGSWRSAPLDAGAALTPASPDSLLASPLTPLTPPSPETNPAEIARGQALPGDRGPRDLDGGFQRPSFWRRIALGRRTQSLRTAQHETELQMQQTASPAFARGSDPRASESRVIPARIDERSPAEREASELAARSTQAVERRIVEPLLQALVSVEAKLERSHVDLVGRSDQVEQRLTQLWDIEEQLGALGELQESLLHVTEQQRRLESALVAQTRILRWLVGGIILSLAVASFAVAFFLRVAS